MNQNLKLKRDELLSKSGWTSGPGHCESAAYVDGYDAAIQAVIELVGEFKGSTELDKVIVKECEKWADWSRMSEKEKDETIEDYYNVAKFQHKQIMSKLKG